MTGALLVDARLGDVITHQGADVLEIERLAVFADEHDAFVHNVKM